MAKAGNSSYPTRTSNYSNSGIDNVESSSSPNPCKCPVVLQSKLKHAEKEEFTSVKVILPVAILSSVIVLVFALYAFFYFRNRRQLTINRLEDGVKQKQEYRETDDIILQKDVILTYYKTGEVSFHCKGTTEGEIVKKRRHSLDHCLLLSCTNALEDITVGNVFSPSSSYDKIPILDLSESSCRSNPSLESDQEENVSHAYHMSIEDETDDSLSTHEGKDETPAIIEYWV